MHSRNILRHTKLGQFDEGQFNRQAFILRRTVIDIAGIEDVEGLEDPNRGTELGLRRIALANCIAGLQQRDRLRILTHQYIAQVLRQTSDE